MCLSVVKHICLILRKLTCVQQGAFHSLLEAGVSVDLELKVTTYITYAQTELFF